MQCKRNAPCDDHWLFQLPRQFSSELVVDERGFREVPLLANEDRTLGFERVQLVQNTKQSQNLGMRSVLR